MKELLTPNGEHHGIGDGEGLVMTKSPKRTPDLASRWRPGGGGDSVSWNTIILSPWFFSPKIGFYRVGIRVCGATMWAQPTWARPGGLCSPMGPPPVVLGSSIFLLLYKNSPQSFVPIRELLFLHKNNIMVVLLKTMSVRVSFSLIYQVQNWSTSRSLDVV